jgi:hypothetical protein
LETQRKTMKGRKAGKAMKSKQSNEMQRKATKSNEKQGQTVNGKRRKQGKARKWKK